MGGLLADWQISQRARSGMITPFEREKVQRAGVLSYGLDSYGYTLSCANEWRIVDPKLSPAELANVVVDPLDPATLDAVMMPYTADEVIIPPHSFVLARSAERWNIPNDLLCVIIGKSSYARIAMLLNVTPLEPGWGSTNPAGGDHITLEISNTAPFSIRLRAGAIGQVLFMLGDAPCRQPYGNDGLYQGQDGIALPRAR